MSNLDLARGRSTVLSLTNQSGATRSPGDLVVIDTANTESFTTSVSSNYVAGPIGVVDESISAGSNGRVVVEGYARNVKVLGTAARGDYLYHSTTAATAAPMAGTTAAVGAFGYTLKAGSGINPSAVIFPPVVTPSGLALGSNSTDVTTSSGLGGSTNYSPSTHFHKGVHSISHASNTFYGDVTLTASGTLGITVPTAGTFNLSATGGAGGSGSSDLAGKQLDYTAFTSPVTINQTSEGAASTVVTSGSVSLDGSTVVQVQFYAPRVATGASTSNVFDLYVDSTIQGRIGVSTSPAAATMAGPMFLSSPNLTPSNASHTFTIKVWRGAGSDGEVTAGAGGTGAYLNGYIRVVRVTS